MAGFAQRAFMDAQRDWNNNKRDKEWDQRVAAFQAKRENDPARQMMLEDARMQHAFDLEKQGLINEGPTEVARINGRFGLDNTQLRETGSNQRSAMAYDIENQQNQLEQFKFLQNPYGDSEGGLGAEGGGVNPAAGYDARRSQLNQYMGGNIGGSPFRFGNSGASPTSQSSATINGVPMEYILGEGRQSITGAPQGDRMATIQQRYQQKQQDALTKRDPVFEQPKEVLQKAAPLPANHRPEMRPDKQMTNYDRARLNRDRIETGSSTLTAPPVIKGLPETFAEQTARRKLQRPKKRWER